MASRFEEDGPFGEAAPEILEDRIWVDGCWDFFHHGTSILFVCIDFEELISKLPLTPASYANYTVVSPQDMRVPCFKHDSWAMS